MLNRRFPHLRIFRNLLKICVIIISISALLLALGLASSQQDSEGNTITNELICIGGAVITDTDNTIECAVGQSFVGLSTSSTGSALVHGVYYPPDVEISDELSGIMLY